MDDDDWRIDFAKAIGVFLNGEEIPDPDQRGRRVVDDSFFVLFNAHHGPVLFLLPARRWGALWAVELDTSRNHATSTVHLAGEKLAVEGRSVVLLKRV